MTRSPLSNFFAAFVVWTPIICIAAGAIWFLAIGAMHLEMITFGSEFFVGNNETPNVPTWKLEGGNNMSSEALMDALNSGDTDRMQLALADYEASAAAAER